MADIGKVAAAEAKKIATAKGECPVAGEFQVCLGLTSLSPGSSYAPALVVEGKAHLYALGPFSQRYPLSSLLRPPSDQLAMVTDPICPPTPNLSLQAGTDITEGIELVLALLRQILGSVDDPTGSTEHLAFLESMAAEIKDMQSKYNLKDQAATEQCEQDNLADKRLVHKGNELRE